MTDARAQEPTIEEILASIRKIISDDDTDAPAKTAAAAESGEEDVLELTDVVFDISQSEPVAAKETPAAPPPETRPAPPEPERAIPLQPAALATPPHTPANPMEQESLVSQSTIEVTSGVLAKLTQPEGGAMAMPISIEGKTVEDIVRELLRPILRQWIDQNLPPMVERLVERELRKISRKAEDL